MSARYYLLPIGMFVISLRSSAAVPVPAPEQQQPVLLIGAVIHPVTAPEIENGDILFDRGKIIAMGKQTGVPSDAMVLDIHGKHVYPALIESNATLGLTEIGAVRATQDHEELGDINPNVQVQSAFNPESELIPVARASGVAMALIRPTGSLLAGRSALMLLDGWTWEQMTCQAPAGMILQWPDIQINPESPEEKSPEGQKKQFGRQLDLLDNTILQARSYLTARSHSPDHIHHKYDARLEALGPVLTGDMRIWIEANTVQEIEAAMAWSLKHGLKMGLISGQQAYRLPDLVKNCGIPVIVTPVYKMPGRRDATFDESFNLPARLYEAGIQFCIAAGGASNVRTLPHQAAKAAAYGLPADIALKAVTLYPAEIFGVADRAGSLAPGKDATLMVTDGDPLEITTRVEKLFILGRNINLDNKHEQLYRKYKKRYENQAQTEESYPPR